MGFKSATNTSVNYKINNLIFSSRLGYQTVESIDRNLKFLYHQLQCRSQTKRPTEAGGSC